MGSNERDAEQTKAPLFCSYRLTLAIIGFFGFVNLYALRVNMSVAMVCMINQTAIQAQPDTPATDLSNLTHQDTKCYNQPSANKTIKDGNFEWSKETQGIILGAFFWGYLVTQIPGGWLAERYGGKRVYGWFMLGTAIATLLTPVGARLSPYLLVALRIIQGLGEGVVFPAMHSIWSKWAPPLERSKLIGFTYAGAQIGNVMTLPLSGLLCDYGFDGGWPSIFYVLGTGGVIWFVCWMLIASDSPALHPRISDRERDYIETTIGTNTAKQSEVLQRLGTPWREIFTSKAVWAVVVAHTCSNWGTYALLTNIPAYMKEVLKFDIKTNGALSAVPYVVLWLFINLAGNIADAIRARGWKTKTVRKISQVLGNVLPGAALVGLGFVSCENPFIAVVVLSLAVGFSGFQYSGFVVNHVDIAPPFAGILFGISNTAATTPGFLAPYTIGRLTTHQTQGEWQVVFYIAAAIYTFGAIVFVLFGEGEVQAWARPYMPPEDTANTSNNMVEQVQTANVKTPWPPGVGKYDDLAPHPLPIQSDITRL